MSKYGSGMNMKDVILQKVTEAEDILSRSNLNKEDQKEVIDSLKEMAYQWCCANAFSSALEDFIKRKLPETECRTLLADVLRSGIREEKFQKTYPF